MVKNKFIYIPPPDKSISQRALIMAYLAEGKSEIKNISDCDDTKNLISCLKTLKTKIKRVKNKIIIKPPLSKEKNKSIKLNCRESATSMRLLAGALCGLKYKKIVLKAQKTLKRRNMKELVFYLKKMGADIKSQKGFFPPLKIYPADLQAAEIKQKEPSAQIKSAVLLASLSAKGETLFKEISRTRDHTEKLLRKFKAPLVYKKGYWKVKYKKLKAAKIEVPGDFSCAAYFLLACVLTKNSAIEIGNVCLNPLRLGFIQILKKMGADIKIKILRRDFELKGNIYAKYSKLKGVKISKKELINSIDEMPLIAAAAVFADGKTQIPLVKSLKNKESDRIASSLKLAKYLGAKAYIKKNILNIYGSNFIKGGFRGDFCPDHRIIMSAACIEHLCDKKIGIKNKKIAEKSYKNFFKDLSIFKKYLKKI
ncbi:MAG: 3-phosphoshikimate 1-carboxyvinyltransferase [Elusimicrobia bacterium]|nr:3-phosphoshikimate 1-carboxyvinyltransferase [Elusimicrobiota bacterium]